MIGSFPEDPPSGGYVTLTDEQLAGYSKSLIVKAAITAFVVGSVVDAILFGLYFKFWRS